MDVEFLSLFIGLPGDIITGKMQNGLYLFTSFKEAGQLDK